MPSWSRWWPEQVYELVRLWPSARMILIGRAARYSAEKRVAETRASAENLKPDSLSGYSGVIGTSSMPLHKRKKGAPIHDESGTSSGLAQCPGRVAASGETRRIPRVPPLSFCGTPQGGGAGGPHQTVARPFTKLDRPLRGSTAVRRDLSEGMVRESWAGI